MNYKLLIALGISSIFLVTTCIAAVLLMSTAGQLIFRQEKASQPIRIAPVAPLTPIAYTTQQIVESPPGLIAAAIEQPPPTQTATATSMPTDTPAPTATPSPTNTPTPTVTPVPITQNDNETRLVIPRLNLDSPILFSPIENETWRVDHLGQAVGYLEGTAPPGSDSNFVLAGHVTLETGEYGPFAGLGQLAAGDMLTVYEGKEAYHYVVDSLKVVDRIAVEVVYPSKTGQITLITCTNWNKEEGRYTDRVVVKGRLVKEPFDSG